MCIDVTRYNQIQPDISSYARISRFTVHSVPCHPSPSPASPPIPSVPLPSLQFNPEQKGFYRVHYSTDMLAALTEAIPSLPASDRLGLLDEAFALVISHVCTDTQTDIHADYPNTLIQMPTCTHKALMPLPLPLPLHCPSPSPSPPLPLPLP